MKKLPVNQNFGNIQILGKTLFSVGRQVQLKQSRYNGKMVYYIMYIPIGSINNTQGLIMAPLDHYLGFRTYEEVIRYWAKIF
jgi:hypothetical protein